MQLAIKTSLSCLFIFLFTIANGQSINADKLMKHLEFLADDDLQGRETQTEGNRKAQAYILNEFQSLELESHYTDFQQKFNFDNRREQKEAVNIVSFVPGKSSRKLLVITAHYDHVGTGKPDASGDSIFNGADDNASGTAALLIMAEYFKANQPEHGIIFAALDGEEMGLQGAKALIRDFPFPLDQIVININMDMISRNDQNELFASGTYYNPSLKTILEPASANSPVILKFGHDEPNTGPDNWTKSSDHGAFFEKNIPHIYFGVEDHEDYHKPSDEIENIDPEFFAEAVNLILRCTIALDQELPKE